MVRIAIDAMGSEGSPEDSSYSEDKGLEAVVDGTLNALMRVKDDTELILVGDKKKIGNLGRIKVYHSSEVFTMDDQVTRRTVKERKDASIIQTMQIVKDGNADIAMSPGNTGAAVYSATMLLGRAINAGPAIAVPFPNQKGKFTILIDGGAKYDCTERDYFAFGYMGAFFHEYLFGSKNPSVGILNVGKEWHKGPDSLRKAAEYLNMSELNFDKDRPFVEGNDIMNGSIDVVICDGLTGNALLKGSEQVAKTMIDMFKYEFKQGIVRGICAKILQYTGMFDAISAKMKPEAYGGAMLLGTGPVIIGHGASSAKAIESAIYFAEKCSDANKTINPKLKEVWKKYSQLFRK